MARRADAAALAAKVHGGPVAGAPGHADFLAEVEALRGQLVRAEAFHPGEAVALAHARIRAAVPFLERDRALDGEVAAMVALVASGDLLQVPAG